MIDVFLRLWPETYLRAHLAGAVIERLNSEGNVRLTIIRAEDSLIPPAHFVDGVTLPRDRFHIDSKAIAADHAESDPFVIIDDDHLPLYQDWLEIGLRAMHDNPEYGLISSWSVNGEVRQGEVDLGRRSPVWEETESLGCPMFVRRGVLADLPEGEVTRYDTILTQHVRSRGWKVGFCSRLRHNHIGMGYSQVIGAHWMPATPAF